MKMRNVIPQLVALFLSAGMASSLQADSWTGATSDWTETASADRALMGDYEGRWLDAPRGHYHQLNPTLVAQVLNVGAGHYRLLFKQEFDRRANRYLEIDGRLEDDTIHFAGNGWQGSLVDGQLTGHLQQGTNRIRFELGRVVRPSPTLGLSPPAGAIVLFDGSDLGAWEHGEGRDVTWYHLEEEQAMEVRFARNQAERDRRIGGDIFTRQHFGDCRLHVEFRYPVEAGRSGQGRGNSGVFLQNTYEVQILNSYGLTGFWNEGAALYKHTPPLVNASLPPGQWQTYDITYQAPVFEDGQKVKNGRITVRHNGVLVHNDVELLHATAWALDSRSHEAQGPAPIRLQDHGNAIQFRNIWLLEGTGE